MLFFFLNVAKRPQKPCRPSCRLLADRARFVSPLVKCAVLLALLSVVQTSHGAVVFTDTFDNLSLWTVVDADGAGNGAAIVATGGKLHVTNNLNSSPQQHGLYAGQVAPAANARVYFWGVTANGSRDPLNNTNGGGGPVGTFNLSNADGVRDAFVAGTPLGFYIRNRLDIIPEPDVPQTEAMRVVNNDNAAPYVAMAEGAAYDFRVDYTNTQTTAWYKSSSADTWASFSSSTAVTLSGSGMYLNIDAWGGNTGLNGEGAKWSMDQIDITDTSHAVLIAPVPEPGSLMLAVCGCLGLTAARRARHAFRS